MSGHSTRTRATVSILGAALVAVGFGVLTIRGGGAVLFGDGTAREAAGQYVPFVVWFNFVAGLLEELGRIQSTDVVLPLADDSGRELRIRCVVRPEPAQAVLLDRLGLRLPERLRAPPYVARM